MITTVQQKTEEDFELLPDPERLVNGLRDTGYTFNTAVADVRIMVVEWIWTV